MIMRSQLINNNMNRDDMLLFEAYELSKADRILESILPEYGRYIITESGYKLPANTMTKDEFMGSSNSKDHAPWDSASTNTMDYNSTNPLDGNPTMTKHPEGVGIFDGFESLMGGLESLMDKLDAILNKVIEYGGTLLKAAPAAIVTGILAKLLGKGIKFLLRNHDPEAREVRKRDEKNLRVTHAMQKGSKMSDDEMSREIDRISEKLDIKYGQGVSWWREMLWRVSDFFDEGAGKYIAGLGVLVLAFV